MNDKPISDNSIYDRADFHFGEQTCACCLGVIPDEPVEAELLKPLEGVKGETMIPRGSHNFHEDCLQKIEASHLK